MCPVTTISSPLAPVQSCYQLLCEGAVQGAGIRPRVLQLARQFGVVGVVFNRGAGIAIQAQVRVSVWPQFQAALLELLAVRAQEVACQTLPLAEFSDVARRAIADQRFVIAASEPGTSAWHLPLDRGMCATCEQELQDATNPDRYQHLLNACAQCGPRYSVLRQLPFDRQHTTLSAFALCPACHAAYHEPADRRCHEQLISCRACGPAYRLLDTATGDALRGPEAILALLCEKLLAGAVVAIKGVGGFHLCCAATRVDAVQRLRRLKQRPRKPFAMMGTLEQLSSWVELSPAARAELKSPPHPIVIVPAAQTPNDSALMRARQAIAPGLNRLGVMLPYTALQVLLLAQMAHPLVMTSCNRAGEPLICDDREMDTWRDDVDAVVFHDREICQPVEDSVMQMMTVVGEEQAQLIRLGRGTAPRVITVAGEDGFSEQSHSQQIPVLAMGTELKNSVAVAGGGSEPVVLSPYLGDLYQAQPYQRYQAFVPRFLQLLGCLPGTATTQPVRAIAVDAHPDYHSTQQGRELARQWQLPVITVQHHHAHAVAVMAEHQLPANCRVLAMVLDGFGWGEDGTLWGGEILCCDYSGYQRLTHIKPFPLVGGHLTATQPWRNGLALVRDLPASAREQALHQLLCRFSEEKPLLLGVAKLLSAASANTLHTSSAGRLFDGVAALLGFPYFAIHDEAEAAVWLQQQAQQAFSERTLQRLREQVECAWLTADCAMLDPGLFLEALLQAPQDAADTSYWALAFHVWLSVALARVVRFFREQSMADSERLDQHHVVLAGGVMQNGVLVDLLTRALQEQGVRVLLPRQVPANDNGVALGQAVVAMACMATDPSHSDKR